ncbi:MAG: cell envelope integrity protein TolA [Patescibacteria group bacterium]|jgi:hypothetical protein
MNNQNLKDYLEKVASLLDNPNTDPVILSLHEKNIRYLLTNFLTLPNSELDFSKASLKEIISALLSQPDDLLNVEQDLQSKVPYMEEMLAALNEGQSAEEALREKVAADVNRNIETKERKAKLAELAKRFTSSTVNDVSESKITEEEQIQLENAVKERLEQAHNSLFVEAEKIDQLPESQREKPEQNLVQEVAAQIQKSASEDKSFTLTKKEVLNYVENLPISPLDIISFKQANTQTEKKQAAQNIVNPGLIGKEKARTIVETLNKYLGSAVVNFQDTLTQDANNVATLAVANAAPEIVSTGITLSPKQTINLVKTLERKVRDEDQVSKRQEIIRLSKGLRPQGTIAGNPYLLKTNGESFIDRQKRILRQGGITTSSSSKLQHNFSQLQQNLAICQSRIRGLRTTVNDVGLIITKGKPVLYQQLSQRFIDFLSGIPLVGKNVSSWVKISAQKGLQKLWSSFFSSKARSFLVQKIGLNVALNLITPGVGLFVSKAITVGAKIVSQIAKYLTSASFFNSFFAQLGRDVSPSEETKGHNFLTTVAVGATIILIVFMGIFKLSLADPSAYLQTTGDETQVAKNFEIEVQIEPSKISNESLPQTFKVIVRIINKDQKLTDVKMQAQLKRISGTSTSDISSLILAQIPSWETINESETETFEFTVTISNNTDYHNAIILADIVVDAKVGDIQDRETVKRSASAMIGNIEHCFAFVGNWNETDKNLELEAILRIQQFSPKYMADLCQNQTINLVRDYTKLGYCYVPNKNTIIIRDICLYTAANTLYSLVHESGHIYTHRNWPSYVLFRDTVLHSGPIYGLLSESYLCSYPFVKSDSEDFAETIAVYIQNHYFPGHLFRACGSKPIDLQNSYPKHYNFIISLF